MSFVKPNNKGTKSSIVFDIKCNFSVMARRNVSLNIMKLSKTSKIRDKIIFKFCTLFQYINSIDKFFALAWHFKSFTLYIKEVISYVSLDTFERKWSIEIRKWLKISIEPYFYPPF